MTDFNYLSQVIGHNREFQEIMSNLRPGRLTEEKRATLLELGPRIERFLGKDRLAIEAWKEFMSTVKQGFVFRLIPAQRQIVAASLLAGAAIKTQSLQLRPDLHPDLYQARADMLKIDINVPPLSPDQPARVFRARPNTETAEVAKYKRFITCHDVLTRRMSTGGKLDSAIRAFLTDSNKSLAPLGSLRTLDSSAIENAQKNAILGKKVARVNPIPCTSLKTANAYAPKQMAVSLNRFKCVRQKEKGGTDKIFWGGSFARCTNLPQVYAQIEQIMKQENPPAFDLDFHWSMSSFVRPTEGGLFDVNSNSQWIDFGSSSVIFEQEFYNGFGPWAGVLFCIEDDAAEYDAVGEVIDTVGDYAQVVGQTATIVSVLAAAGGVTGPLAVAAGAVSTAASVVNIAADVAGAVVDIVNFFDDDNMIGSINLSGPGDHAEARQEDIKKGTLPQPYDLQESTSGAHYKIEIGTTYTPLAEFNRTWKCTDTDYFFPEKGWYEKGGGFTGNKGDITKIITFDPAVNSIEATPVTIQDSSGPGNAYVMKGYPKLESNNTVGIIKVHWGIQAIRSFKFKFNLKALRFEKL
jgi:hypothetical protein